MPDNITLEEADVEVRPGFANDRLVRLGKAAIDRLRLDLGGITVLTEAASGAYATTAVIAAMAGADRVFAVARDNRFGSSSHHAGQTLALAAAAGVAERIEIVTGSPYDAARQSQIVTNSGNLRPIDATLIRHLPSNAVIALMYEAWELRAGDIDMAAATTRGLSVVGVNEQHPRIDVFSYLGPLAVRELHDAGIAIYGCHIAVLCDNSFAPPIVLALESLGARVSLARRCEELPRECRRRGPRRSPARGDTGHRQRRSTGCWRIEREARRSCNSGATSIALL